MRKEGKCHEAPRCRSSVITVVVSSSDGNSQGPFHGMRLALEHLCRNVKKAETSCQARRGLTLLYPTRLYRTEFPLGAQQTPVKLARNRKYYVPIIQISLFWGGRGTRSHDITHIGFELTMGGLSKSAMPEWLTLKNRLPNCSYTI